MNDLEGDLSLVGRQRPARRLGAATLQRSGAGVPAAAAAVAFGFTLVTMFAAMHECVHRTAFRSQWLNNGVGWLAWLLSFYNSTFYRHYHGGIIASRRSRARIPNSRTRSRPASSATPSS